MLLILCPRARRPRATQVHCPIAAPRRGPRLGRDGGGLRRAFRYCMRVSELVSLRLENVDLDFESFLQVPHHPSCPANGLDRSNRKSGLLAVRGAFAGILPPRCLARLIGLSPNLDQPDFWYGKKPHVTYTFARSALTSPGHSRLSADSRAASPIQPALPSTSRSASFPCFRN